MTDQLSETQNTIAASSLREIKSSIGLLSTQIEAEILALQGQVRTLQALLKVDQDLARAGILALTGNDRELTFNYLHLIAGDGQTSDG